MRKEISLEDLPGVGPSIAEKLRAAGFPTVRSVAMVSAEELISVAEIGEATARKIVAAAREALGLDSFVSGEDVLKHREKIGWITTGSKKLDELLGGGVETQAVTEAFGEFGSGKTQLAHQLCVNVQLPREQGGLEGKAVYIDTENTFRPERIRDMAVGLGLDPMEALRNIRVARVYNTDQQMVMVKKVEEFAEKEGIRLLVVDSVTSLFRAEYHGRERMPERQQKLNRHLMDLHLLADSFDMAVYVTNQVLADPSMFFGDPTRPVGGHILAHAATTRVYLRKSKNPKRIARIYDSPCLPEREAVFAITQDGIRDAE
jgi:DNA repair protein RadA